VKKIKIGEYLAKLQARKWLACVRFVRLATNHTHGRPQEGATGVTDPLDFDIKFFPYHYRCT